MLNKLKELVFGLGEFEKTKIDVRYELINSMISSLKLNEISDFELLEDCISKIKDQLRVKSSNLNKIIADSSKRLKKKDVNDILDKLNKVKYDFLERAFNLIKRDSGVFDELKANAQELDSRIDNLDKKESGDEGVESGDEKVVYENDYLKVKVSNGKVPYLIVDFASNVDYSFLKSLSGYLFEEYSCHGTNIIVDKNKAMIVPRFDNDNLFELKKIEVDLDEVFRKINERDASVQKGVYKEPSISLAKEDDSEEQITEVKDTAEYVEIDKKPMEFKTKKYDEDSLDAILMGTEEKRITPKPKPQNDNNDVSVQRGDVIEVERKEKEEEKSEIEIERVGNRDEGVGMRDEGVGNRDEGVGSRDEGVGNGEKSGDEGGMGFEIYRDDKIRAYLKEDSKVLGELVIEPLNESIQESDYSYMWIFSKIFSSVLFEVTHSAGTNIIMDYSKNKIRIIPRMQDDNLDLLWTPREESDEFLEQIKNKLVKVMQGALEGALENDSKKEEKLEVADEDVKENAEEGKHNETSKEKSSREKKVNHLLEHLRKIP